MSITVLAETLDEFLPEQQTITPEIQDQYGKNSRKPEFTVHIHLEIYCENSVSLCRCVSGPGEAFNIEIIVTIRYERNQRNHQDKSARCVAGRYYGVDGY